MLSTSLLAVPPATVVLLKLDMALVLSASPQVIEIAGQEIRRGRIMGLRSIHMKGGEFRGRKLLLAMQLYVDWGRQH